MPLPTLAALRASGSRARLVRFWISSLNPMSGLRSAPIPPPHLFLQECDSRAVIFAFVQECDSKRLIFCWFFSRRLSPECADSKRVRRLGMRPGRWSPQKLFWCICKSVILNALLCAVVKGWVCKEVLPRVSEARDCNTIAKGFVKALELEGARTTAGKDAPLRGAASFIEHTGCTPIPNMFYIFYRASKEGLWKYGQRRASPCLASSSLD